MAKNRRVEIQIEMMPLGNVVSRYRVDSPSTDNGHAGWSDWNEEKDWFLDEEMALSAARRDALASAAGAEVSVTRIGF